MTARSDRAVTVRLSRTDAPSTTSSLEQAPKAEMSSGQPQPGAFGLLCPLAQLSAGSGDAANARPMGAMLPLVKSLTPICKE